MHLRNHHAELALLALCAVVGGVLAVTPEQLCAASGDVRKAYEDGYVACLNGAVWEVRSCPSSPPGLRFSERDQTCVP